MTVFAPPLTAGVDGQARRVMPAFLVEVFTSRIGVSACPIWVTQINKAEGWVRWRFPHQPYDVERVASFEAVHSTLDGALAAVARLLPPLAEIPDNVLADAPANSNP